MYLRREVDVGGLLIRLSPHEAELVSTLLMRRVWVTRGEIIEAMWPDPDLEPENAYNSVSVYIRHLRDKGVPVINRIGFGYSMGPNYFASPS